MRIQALGIAMVLLGAAGAIASWGVWWILYRYGSSLGEASEVACVEHCGGVDGPFLAGLIASCAIAAAGLIITAVRARTR